MKLRNSCPLVLTVHKCRTRCMAKESMKNNIIISSIHKNKRPTYTGYNIIYSDRMPMGYVYMCASIRVREAVNIKDTICLYYPRVALSSFLTNSELIYLAGGCS